MENCIKCGKPLDDSTQVDAIVGIIFVCACGEVVCKDNVNPEFNIKKYFQKLSKN